MFSNVFISAVTMKIKMLKLDNSFKFQTKDVSVSDRYCWDFELKLFMQTEKTFLDVYITNNKGDAHVLCEFFSSHIFQIF